MILSHSLMLLGNYREHIKNYNAHYNRLILKPAFLVVNQDKLIQIDKQEKQKRSEIVRPENVLYNHASVYTKLTEKCNNRRSKILRKHQRHCTCCSCINMLRIQDELIADLLFLADPVFRAKSTRALAGVSCP